MRADGPDMGDHTLRAAARRLPRFTARRRARRLLAATALLAGIAATPAAAAPIELSFTDPVDQTEAGIDLVSGTLSQDTLTGGLTAHLELAGALTASTYAQLVIVTGNIAPDGTSCVARVGAEFITTVSLHGDPLTARYRIGRTSSQSFEAAATRAGNAIDVTVKGTPNLYGSTATCAAVSAGTMSTPYATTFTAQDDVLAKATLAPTKVGNQTAGSATTDSDGDGVGDLVDRCRNDPGVQPDGCPRTDGASSLRLGARRLVVERTLTLASGATACPTTVKVIVKLGRHRLGAAKLPATAVAASSAAPAGCKVSGVVRLKRRTSRGVVRVAITGTGIAPVAQNINA